MIPAYNRTKYLEKTLSSVLSQDPGAAEMQIEVVDDASSTDDPEALVRRVAGDRVSFVRNPRNIGLMANFNNCVERSRGHWVHILHTDDFVFPGYYERLKSRLESRFDVGAAFCRNAFIDENERYSRASELLRPTAGTLAGFLERIALGNCVRCPAIVVRRCVYERLGGFRLDLSYTGDWEMWIRVAAHYPIWYEPAPLAAFREHSTSASDGFFRTGEDCRQMLRCIEISQPWLPPNRAETILQHAREMYHLRLLGRTTQDDEVLRLVEELRKVSRPGPINRYDITEALFRAAQIHYRHGRRFQGLAFAVRALITRPIVAGRPLKRAVNSLFGKSPAQAGRT